MIFWLNAQLPPSLAEWLSITFGVSAVTLQDIGLSDAQDIEIFNIDLVIRLGSPPQILWLTCGNITIRDLQRIFTRAFPEALELLQNGENIVEIGRA